MWKRKIHFKEKTKRKEKSCEREVWKGERNNKIDVGGNQENWCRGKSRKLM